MTGALRVVCECAHGCQRDETGGRRMMMMRRMKRRRRRRWCGGQGTPVYYRGSMPRIASRKLRKREKESEMGGRAVAEAEERRA